MKKKSPIVGKKIKAMTDGGWELTGVVTHDKNDRVVLQIDSGEILLLFKKKISAVLILSEAVIEKPQATAPIKQEPVNNDNFLLFKPAKKDAANNLISKSDEDLSEGGVSLPHEVLLSVPEESKFRGGEDDFSISMTSLFGNNSGRISVTVDDKSK
jgi:hypothetical protein